MNASQSPAHKSPGRLIKTNPDTLILIKRILDKSNFENLDVKHEFGEGESLEMKNGEERLYYTRLDAQHIFIHGGDLEAIKRQVRAHFERNIYLDTAPRL